MPVTIRPQDAAHLFYMIRQPVATSTPSKLPPAQLPDSGHFDNEWINPGWPFAAVFKNGSLGGFFHLPSLIKECHPQPALSLGKKPMKNSQRFGRGGTSV